MYGMKHHIGVWFLLNAWDIGYFMLWPCHAGQGGGCTRSTIWVDYASESRSQNTPCMLIAHKDNKNTIHVYLVTAMTHVIALEAGQSSQGAPKPIYKNIHCHFIICHVSAILPVYFHHYWEIGKSRPIYPHPSNQCTTGRGLLSVNVLLAMLFTVTVFCQVIEQRFLCYSRCIVCRKRIWGYPFTFPL